MHAWRHGRARLHSIKNHSKIISRQSIKSQRSPETPAFRLDSKTWFPDYEAETLTATSCSRDPNDYRHQQQMPTSTRSHGDSLYVYSLTIEALLNIAQLLFQSPHSSSVCPVQLYFQILIIRCSLNAQYQVPWPYKIIPSYSLILELITWINS